MKSRRRGRIRRRKKVSRGDKENSSTIAVL